MNPRFRINEVVTLLKDLPQEGLKAGATGVVVAEFRVPNEAYEVEFCDSNGRTITQATLEPHQLQKDFKKRSKRHPR
ncbi:MAG: DUF4926 domain-containing protein [Elusimicrobiota bacterium]|jgi:hypothetical protein